MDPQRRCRGGSIVLVARDAGTRGAMGTGRVRAAARWLQTAGRLELCRLAGLRMLAIRRFVGSASGSRPLALSVGCMGMCRRGRMLRLMRMARGPATRGALGAAGVDRRTSA